MLLDALWQTPDPDEALNQFERFVAAAGPRTAYLELLAARPDLLREPGPALRARRAGDADAHRAAGAAQRARRSRDLRGAREAGATSGASWRPVLAPAARAIASAATGCAGSSRRQELGITWRMLLGVTDAERFSLEMTALAEAALAAAWLLALDGDRRGPRRPARPARAG